MSVPNYPLGQGLRPYVLPHLRYIVGEGALPQTKIEHVGFLNLLQTQNKPKFLRLNNAAGHRESVQIKYLQRYTEDYAGTDESAVCNNTLFDPYKEATADVDSFAFIPLHIDDETIARYEDEASAFVTQGTPPGPFMNEMMERMMVAANAILSKVRTQLLTKLVANIGINRATGSNATKSINIPLNVTNNPLASGATEILTDYSINLLSGNPIVLADPAGLWSKFNKQQYAKSPNFAGLNTVLEASRFMSFEDAKVSSLLAINDILVIEPNSVQIVEYMVYTAYKSGWKPGASMFGTIPLPVQVNDRVVPVEFDYQLRYSDCATTLTDQYYGTPIAIQRGYTLILSKKTGLFQIPSDAYRAIDPNVGVNGVLRYSITNV